MMWAMVGAISVLLLIPWPPYARKQAQPPAPARVELSPEVRYEIQETTRRAVLQLRKELTRPVLPMVAPNPKVKVKR